jgi:ATP-dependent phosphoenolpyruvate carboxykinase
MVTGGTAATPSDEEQELLILLRAAGVFPNSAELARLTGLHTMLRGFSARLAALDLGDTPPATTFDPGWE